MSRILPKFNTIQLKVSGEVLLIDLARPGKRNALNKELLNELLQAFEFCVSADDLKAALLRGLGPCFCAGLDLNWILDCVEQDRYEFIEVLDGLYRYLVSFEKLFVVEAHGAVYGGGLGFLACADYVFGWDNVELCLSEIRLGICPAIVSAYLVPIIGLKKFRRYSMSGEKISANEAKELGIVDQLLLGDKSEERVQSYMANKLLPYNFLAIKGCKKLVNLYNESYCVDYAERKKILIELLRSGEFKQAIEQYKFGQS